jgi:hypothetical protein
MFMHLRVPASQWIVGGGVTDLVSEHAKIRSVVSPEHPTSPVDLERPCDAARPRDHDPVDLVRHALCAGDFGDGTFPTLLASNR